MRSLRQGLVTMLALGVVIAGCASHVPKLNYDSLDQRPSEEVIAVWEAHREVLVRAIKEKKFTIREFNDSLGFFERITGVRAHQDSTRYGTMPNERLPQDLERWDDWFRANASRLRISDLQP